jgi:hypothetical protein
MKERTAAFSAAAAFVAAMVWLSPARATHDPDLDDGEVKCQLAAGSAVSKFAGKKIKCLNKCWSAQRKGDASRVCTAGRDAVTQACIDAVETKALAAYDKKCTPTDCPECYDGGNCGTDGDGKVNTAESLIDVNDLLLSHCAESGGATPDEAKCQDTRAKTFGKFVGALGKCTGKCISALHKGDATRECDPAGGTDATTEACASAAEAKCVAAVDKKCTADPPECNANNGTSLCGTVRSVVASQYGEFYCGS